MQAQPHSGTGGEPGCPRRRAVVHCPCQHLLSRCLTTPQGIALPLGRYYGLLIKCSATDSSLASILLRGMACHAASAASSTRRYMGFSSACVALLLSAL